MHEVTNQTFFTWISLMWSYFVYLNEIFEVTIQKLKWTGRRSRIDSDGIALPVV